MTSKEIRKLKEGTLLYVHGMGFYRFDKSRIRGRGKNTAYYFGGFIGSPVENVRLATHADVENYRRDCIKYFNDKMKECAFFDSLIKEPIHE